MPLIFHPVAGTQSAFPSPKRARSTAIPGSFPFSHLANTEPTSRDCPDWENPSILSFSHDPTKSAQTETQDSPWPRHLQLLLTDLPSLACKRRLSPSM